MRVPSPISPRLRGPQSIRPSILQPALMITREPLAASEFPATLDLRRLVLSGGADALLLDPDEMARVSGIVRAARYEFVRVVPHVGPVLTVRVAGVVAMEDGALPPPLATRLQFETDPAWGESGRYEASDGDWRARATARASRDPAVRDRLIVRYADRSERTSYTLRLQAPYGRALAVGRYEDAQPYAPRAGAQAPVAPALDFRRAGVPSPGAGGRFVIDELLLRADGTVTRLRARFEQRAPGGALLVTGDVAVGPS